MVCKRQDEVLPYLPTPSSRSRCCSSLNESASARLTCSAINFLMACEYLRPPGSKKEAAREIEFVIKGVI